MNISTVSLIIPNSVTYFDLRHQSADPLIEAHGTLTDFFFDTRSPPPMEVIPSVITIANTGAKTMHGSHEICKDIHGLKETEKCLAADEEGAPAPPGLTDDTCVIMSGYYISALW
jgi:hypothetical protein